MIIRKEKVFADSGSASAAAELTIDELLRNQVRKGPQRTFVVDPPNKKDITGGEPQRLTFRQIDQKVEALAGILREIGLRQDDIVAVRMPNTTEMVVTLLAIWRAGLVACPLPVSWRRREWAEALDAVAPKAIVTATNIGEEDAALTACLMAEKQFSIRFVAAFGTERIDGVIALDPLIQAALDGPGEESGPISRPDAGQHVAAITFMETVDGLSAVPRCHGSWIAAAMRIAADLKLAPGERMLSPFVMSQMTGLVGGFLPSLLTGATLILHHPFDLYALAAQVETHRPTVAAFPSALSEEFLSLDGNETLRALLRIIPFGLGARPLANVPDVLAVHDYASFAEQAMLPLVKGPDGTMAIRSGRYFVRDGHDNSPEIARVSEADPDKNWSVRRPHDLIRFAKKKPAATPSFTLEVSGPMAPDGLWVDVVRPTAARGRRDKPGSPLAFPVVFEKSGNGIFRPSAFAPGIGAVGGMPVNLVALDQAYSAIDGTEAAAVAPCEDSLSVAIVPKGTVALDTSELRQSIDALAIAEHKIAGRVATLASIPRTGDGEIDRPQIAARTAAIR